MQASDKVIVTDAITGGIHTPSMTPYLPITPKQIADEAVGAAEAGAAVVHIHVRDPVTGAPSSDLDLFRQVVKNIQERSDVIINITTGGGLFMTAEERLKVVPALKPELASFNLGSMNFSLHPIVARYRKWKYPWEKPFLAGSKSVVFRNTFSDMEYFAKTMYQYGTKPELECYDVGHLYNANQLVIDRVLKAPLHLQFVMGITGGIGSTLDDLVHLRQTADRLFGSKGYTWSAAAAGRNQFPLCVAAATMGGHVRVGLEDNLYLRKGVLAPSNAALVQKAKALVYEVTGREAASPAEAREILGLKKS